MIWPWARRKVLIDNIRVRVIRQLAIADADLTEMVNRTLRENPRYNLPPLTSWEGMSTEEAEKVLERYGRMYTK